MIARSNINESEGNAKCIKMSKNSLFAPYCSIQFNKSGSYKGVLQIKLIISYSIGYLYTTKFFMSFPIFHVFPNSKC